jgi:hypothetical protein
MEFYSMILEIFLMILLTIPRSHDPTILRPRSRDPLKKKKKMNPDFSGLLVVNR